jgi:hypothetical protein
VPRPTYFTIVDTTVCSCRANPGAIPERTRLHLAPEDVPAAAAEVARYPGSFDRVMAARTWSLRSVATARRPSPAPRQQRGADPRGGSRVVSHVPLLVRRVCHFATPAAGPIMPEGGQGWSATGSGPRTTTAACRRRRTGLIRLPAALDRGIHSAR